MHDQSCLTLCNPVDCSPPASSTRGIFQAEWVAISYSRGSSWPRDQNQISCVSWIGRQIPYHLGSPSVSPYYFLSLSTSFHLQLSTRLHPIIISYLIDWNTFVVDLASNLASLQSFYYFCCSTMKMDFPDSSVSKESACNAGDLGSIPESGRSAGERIGYPLQYSWVSLVVQLVKNPSLMQENWVWSLGWEEPRRRERLPTLVFWSGEFLQSVGSQRVGHNWDTFTFTMQIALLFSPDNINNTRSI